jgi:WD40 repeat protein
MTSVAFHPNNRIVAVGFGDGRIGFWDVTQAAQAAETKAHTEGLTSLAFSRNGWLASGSVDHLVKVWNDEPGLQPQWLVGKRQRRSPRQGVERGRHSWKMKSGFPVAGKPHAGIGSLQNGLGSAAENALGSSTGH